MFTETYIEMVINNPDIQSLCKYNKGDWFWNGEKPYLYCKSGLGSSNPHDYKWLPTLEDLFRMVDITKDGRIEIAEFSDGYCVSQNDFYVSDIQKNIKECLLELIMIINHNKSWNPDKKEWEEINGS